MAKGFDPSMARLLGGNSHGAAMPTQHETLFSRCRLGVVPHVENGEVKGFILQILDPNENHVYRMPLTEEGIEAVAAAIHALPRIGDRVGDDATPS